MLRKFFKGGWSEIPGRDDGLFQSPGRQSLGTSSAVGFGVSGAGSSSDDPCFNMRGHSCDDGHVDGDVMMVLRVVGYRGLYCGADGFVMFCSHNYVCRYLCMNVACSRGYAGRTRQSLL